MADESEIALACAGVDVRYGTVLALSGVSVAFRRGMIHAVVGQNGAGKTTFARVASGLVRPTSGTLRIGGRPVALGSVGAARAAGIELVHQSFALPPSFTVAEAMEFGSTRPDFPLYTRRGLQARWRDHLQGLGVDVPLSARIRDLPVETQQAVEIARALVSNAKVLILDEPTAVLSPVGISFLSERVRRLRDQGVTILLILHKIHEVMAVAETVTALRGGRLVEGPTPIGSITPEQLATAIIGSAEAAALAPADLAAATGEEPVLHLPISGPHGRLVLWMRSVSTLPDPDGPALDGVDLHVEAGRIVGVAGVEGNGQRALVRAISGLADVSVGNIELAGDDVTRASLAERRSKGLRIIPFERNVEGLSLTTSLWENWSARDLVLRSALGFIDPKALKKACRSALERWSVRFNAVEQPAGSLSGGNAQKVILAREIDDAAALIIAAQPTRGLDIGATAFVWQSLRAARARGAGVLVISSDLDELFDISDRLVVMMSGRVVAEFQPPYDLEAVGSAMTRARAEAA
ncbi:ABC transporter ATP-binding protein [Kaistia algarum]|uniref:ABC transporter ATP-binding protein n=1 Tax=Kaistia algarum TaxID=2083279 RepID=UPI000CE87242|nr:ATP-binding cassette domain-containing protein [Kaistia algarum]MCX5514362.1 ATP-binding cassette domain-containing protein [Kaistia algarum]PPE79110.1 ABC transporter ATP-binding protein [Kaistia algarum]